MSPRLARRPDEPGRDRAVATYGTRSRDGECCFRTVESPQGLRATRVVTVDARYRPAIDSGPEGLAAHPPIRLSGWHRPQRRMKRGGWEVELHSLADIPESTEQVPHR
jgi:hypothetical protein